MANVILNHGQCRMGQCAAVTRLATVCCLRTVGAQRPGAAAGRNLLAMTPGFGSLKLSVPSSETD